MSDLYNIIESGNRIRACRNSLNLSQEDLSERIESITGSKVSRQLISQWETKGIPIKSVTHLYALCQIFECDPGYLLCEFDTLRIGSAPLSDRLGLSTAALDNLRSATLSGNPYVEIVSQMLQDETFLQQAAAVVAADYGHISQIFDALDPFTGERYGRIIGPEDLHAIDRQQLFSSLCSFLDTFKKSKEGLSNLETD